MTNQDQRTKNQEHRNSCDSDTLVRVEGVSKRFCKSLKRSLWYGVKDVMTELNPYGRSSCLVSSVSLEEQSLIQEQRTNKQEKRTTNHELEPAETLPPLRRDEFWAVRDVSFELKRGECLGLIGRNGAGKSTLLKMLNGIIKPDAGRIEIRGRVGALIELSAGFNPILTGRENIYVKGSVLGFTKKEMDSKFDAIVDFAEIGDFLDMPVQNYSSGMRVRLGFAVSAQMEPDVLIVDEVLAVGDVGFRMKCYNKISRLMDRSCVIFVSHSMPMVSRICSQVLVMEKGVSQYCGKDTAQGISYYFSMFGSAVAIARGGERVSVKSVILRPSSQKRQKGKVVISLGDNLEVYLYLHFMDELVGSPQVAVQIYNQELRTVAVAKSRLSSFLKYGNGLDHVVKTCLHNLRFCPGLYSLGVTIESEFDDEICARIENAAAFQMTGAPAMPGDVLFWEEWVSLPVADGEEEWERN